MMNLNGVRNFRHHRRLPSSDRFLDIFSPPKPSSAVADEFTESDVLWTVSDSTRDSPSTQLAHRKLCLRLPEDGARPRAIPKPTRDHPHPQRMMIRNSAPVEIPQAMRKMKRFSELDDYCNEEEEEEDESDEEEEEMLPPHEIVARKVKATSSSVLEGVGRTLKGRDLRRVRDAVWRQSGFID